ncbi:MAG TPA: acetylxylan esterase [Chitinophagaceae bacterium]
MIKKSIAVLLLAAISCGTSMAQTPEQMSAQQSKDVYQKPLDDVLKTIQQQYGVTLLYEAKNTKGKVVSYAVWRFRSDVKETLDNVLKPLDMVWKQTGKDSFEITKYEYFRKDFAEGQKQLDHLLTLYSTTQQFEARKKEIQECIFQALGIDPVKPRTNLNPIFRSKREMDGYTVENVAFESIPGYFVCGSLYRPTTKGKHAAILCPHGHFYNKVDPSIPDERGRYRPDMQYRCAALAKMGAIVFDYDMYSYGESVLQSGSYKFHKTNFAIAIQTWNSIRAIDFLSSLPDVDTKKIGVTGASGGGTQTFIVTALDNRITASCPVVMVSASFYGGCNCESGLPIHSCGNTNNAEISAMAAPHPQLVISDGSDWTQTVPSIEYPYLKKVYGFYGAADQITNVHLPDDQHDYGKTKRIPMYQFFAKTFGLDIKKITGKDGMIDESKIKIETAVSQQVFSTDFPLPSNALKSHEAIVKAFQLVQSGSH